MIYKRTVAPVYTDFISLDRVKQYIRRDDDEDDDVITDIIAGAHETVERESGTLIGTQTWTLQLACWSRCIEIIKQPVQSISSITYKDGSNQNQTVSSSLYRLIAPTRGTAHIEFDLSFDYPALYIRSDAITVTFIAGSTANEQAKRAIRHLISSDNENREGQELPPAVIRACQQLRGW